MDFYFLNILTKQTENLGSHLVYCLRLYLYVVSTPQSEESKLLALVSSHEKWSTVRHEYDLHNWCANWVKTLQTYSSNKFTFKSTTCNLQQFSCLTEAEYFSKHYLFNDSRWSIINVKLSLLHHITLFRSMYSEI